MDSKKEKYCLSIIIPFMNEEQTLPLLREKFQNLNGMPNTWEIIFVSDGTTDRSIQIIEEWANKEKDIKLIILTRNFGHQSAISAGLSFAKGDFVGIMDADLQDNPEVLLTMYNAAKNENLDIVYAVRAKRQENFLKCFLYNLFYKLYSFIAESPVHGDSGDFCVMSRRALNYLLSMPEKIRFVRGLRSWLGLKEKALPVFRSERAAGKPQYSWSKLFKLAILGLTSFSIKPLRFATMAGILLCVGASIMGFCYLFLALFTNIHEQVPGFSTIVLLLLFLDGLLFLMLGIMGEYIGQIFLEVKKRPTYLIDRTLNIEK